MRPIDADALKQDLATFVVGGAKAIEETTSGTNWINGIHTAYREIDSMPTIDFFGYWIPVEERLPEEDDRSDVLPYYLVWYEYFRYGDYNKPFQTYGIAYFLYGRWCGDDMNGTDVKVIAWMPIPKPYEKEVKKDDSI